MADLRHHINSLCEPGNSRPHGAWIDGHCDVTEFMFAVRDEYQRLVPSWDVKRGYYRVLRGAMHFTNEPGRGAAPATWVEW